MPQNNAIIHILNFLLIYNQSLNSSRKTKFRFATGLEILRTDPEEFHIKNAWRRRSKDDSNQQTTQRHTSNNLCILSRCATTRVSMRVGFVRARVEPHWLAHIPYWFIAKIMNERNSFDAWVLAGLPHA